jgi:predicted nuclease of predicted toxin-antitoxin system
MNSILLDQRLVPRAAATLPKHGFNAVHVSEIHMKAQQAAFEGIHRADEDPP